MAHPDASRDDLDAVVDAWSWTVFPDDLFDGPAGRETGKVTALCRRFVAIVEGYPEVAPDPGRPMETALHDMWGRLIAGMPASWAGHRSRLWTEFLLSMISEAGNRDTGRPPALMDYLRMRRASLAAWPTLLIERTGHFQVPEAVTGHPVWRELHDLWIDVLAHINDVFSLEKDESFGEVSNIVLVLEHERNLERGEAVRCVQDLVRAKTSAFLRISGTVLTTDFGARLTPADREAVERYLTGMRDYAAANYFYSRHVKRYSPHGGSAAERLSYVEHLR
ncbi:pentalenene synthase [Streptomyces sp. NPDC059247]|uniref:terpene synthase family protein n=1 Tax=Streptomyces sp. NPDC059247 TaxID=3346790 RepID=UPI00367809D2